MKFNFQIATLFLLLAVSVSGETRVWTLNSGGTIVGDYFSAGTTTLVIKAGGTNCLIKISNLSTNDQIEVVRMQRKIRLDAETKQLTAAKTIELTKKLIENYPEKVDGQNGWMDAKFLNAGGDAKNFESLNGVLGFVVEDKEGEIYTRCTVIKGLSTKIDKVIMGLQHGDRIRLIGNVVVPAGNRSGGWFSVKKIEVIKSAADEKPPENP